MIKKFALMINVCFFFAPLVSAQIDLRGRVVDRAAGEFLEYVKIECMGSERVAFTHLGGFFKLEKLKSKEVILIFHLKGYKTLRYPVEVQGNDKLIDLGLIGLDRIDSENETAPDIDVYEIENFTGLLRSNKDLFSKTVAYDFSTNFFRPRFLNTNHTSVMLNSVPLNKIYSGRPEWSNWGGLNDALRQQVNYAQMETSKYHLGGLSHSMDMLSKASGQRNSLKVSMALSNKNYQTRIMTTYSSGILTNGWAYMFSASFRYAHQGYRSGTGYRAYSLMTSIDKKLGKRNLINATFIYAFNARGKSSPMTQEVFEMKNPIYNSYWGYQQDQSRNSREKKIAEPIFQLNHEFMVNRETVINNHFTYQSGVSATSRLDYGGGRFLENNQVLVGGGANPDPTYYQKLPSYFLKDATKPDFGRAYLAEKKFKADGQINWNELYDFNRNNLKNHHAIYALYNDEKNARMMAVNTNISTKINQKVSFSGGLSYRVNFSKNYARMHDLLGGNGYLDVDLYADNILEAQSNLKHQNRVVKEQEKFRYNYELQSREVAVFATSTYVSKRTEVNLAADFQTVSFQRNGLYENGFFPGSLSYGESKEVNFQPFGVKLGFSHSLTGRHIFLCNINYLEKAPIFNHVFSNVRVSNEIVEGLKKETNMGLDMKYVWRSPHFIMHLSGYYLLLTDASRISFYYADGLTGLDNAISSAYVQEVITGMDRQNMGLEFSLELPILANFKFKCVASIGTSTYVSNPKLYLNSNTFSEPLFLGRSFLKGYYSSGGPQHAYSIGFEYSSPKYWWLSASFNYFDKSFLSIAPITRTSNFFLDSDGLPISNLDPDLAKRLLRQETLASYGSMNLVGGKTWKINNLYLGLFAAINNITNNIFKTGGFEQSRTANYTTLKEDKTREKPLFGPKYWFGYGTTFYSSFYIRI